MSTPASAPKPGEFFIGVMDFFAVLVPGAVLVALLQPRLAYMLPLALPAEGAPAWAAFFVVAYVAGYFLFAIGSVFDKLYDHIYLRFRRPEHFKAVKAFGEPKKTDAEPDTLVGRVYERARRDLVGTNMYDWALSLARLHMPGCAAEVDRYQASSKLFRSLPFALFVAAYLMRSGGFWYVALTLLAALFCIYFYCDLRWHAAKRVYEYYLLFHRYPPNRKSEA